MKPELEAEFVNIVAYPDGKMKANLTAFVMANIVHLSPSEIGAITGMTVEAIHRLPGQAKVISEWTTKVIQASRDTEAQKIG